MGRFRSAGLFTALALFWSAPAALSAAPDSLVLPKAEAKVVAGEVVLGSLLGAALGYGVGLAAEALFCEDCDPSEPGGDTPGLIVGVPIGATLGVWIVGRRDPPPGRIIDTYLGALVGTAGFAGFAELLEEQPDLLRWSGVVFAGSFAALGWQKSRPKGPRSGVQSLWVPRVGSEPGLAIILKF